MKKTNKKILKKTFAKGQVTAKDINDLLIQETLAYRDKMKEETGSSLTVSHVRLAVKLLLQALKKGVVDENANAHSVKLAKVWLKKLQRGTKTPK